MPPEPSLAQPSSTPLHPTLSYTTLPSLHHPNPTQAFGCAQHSTSDKFAYIFLRLVITLITLKTVTAHLNIICLFIKITNPFLLLFLFFFY